MALDGILASLVSAADAACGGIIEAAEIRLSRAKPTPKYDYKPGLAIDLLRECGREDASAALSAALNVTANGALMGWLVQLRRLRNTAVHRSALGRTYYVGGDRDGEIRMDVPGLGPEDPVIYLRDARAKVDRLCTQLLKEVAWLAPGQVVGQPSRSVNITL